ncbi:MAG: DUF4157 domain-containing protein [Bacteroidota bacterium]
MRANRKKEKEVLQKKTTTGGNGKKVDPPNYGLSFIDKPIQRKVNKTGLPDHVRSGVESLSGIDMSDVRVHYNSSQPAQLSAHAYAQGNQIHIGPGQEKHLPHEAWHVVQQKQGRVKPTMQMKNLGVNDDTSLEAEADTMGSKAVQRKATNRALKKEAAQGSAVQRYSFFNPGRKIRAAPVIAAISKNDWDQQVKNQLSRPGRVFNGDPAQTIQLVDEVSTELGRYEAAAGRPIEQLMLLGKIQTNITDLKGTNTSEPWTGFLARGEVWHTVTTFHTLIQNAIAAHLNYGYQPLSAPDPVGAPTNTVSDYHFGLNEAGAVHDLGHRMDHILNQGGGTVAEYDWNDPADIGAPPAHVPPGTHTRLSGGIGLGQSAPSAAPGISAARHNASINNTVVYPDKFQQHTRARKQYNNPTAKPVRETNWTDVHVGVDYSKSALMDQLVQGKTIHFHLTGLQSRWKGGANVMNGQDFRETLAKNGAYVPTPGSGPFGTIKDDVTLRELRFIYRFWTRPLALQPDPTALVPNPPTHNYTFQGHVIFYYKPAGGTIKKVPPPWLWGNAETGDSITGMAPADITNFHNRR